MSIYERKLIGVVSFGSLCGCERDEKPGVYSRVASVRNWIDQKMKEEGSNTTKTDV